MAVSKIPYSDVITGTLYTGGFAEGLQDNSSTINRCGRVVMLTINVKYTGSGTGAISASGWIPNGFRPVNFVQFIGGDGSQSGQTVGNINTSGTATFYFGSTKYCQCTVTFLTE